MWRHLYIPGLIVIPAVALGTWVLMVVLLARTPLKLVTTMEATRFFQLVQKQNLRVDGVNNGWNFSTDLVPDESSGPSPPGDT
ncbi:hypothetical protein B0T25DRAFT_568037 [Lasiosphaeria hispida]|uniref:Uncharacterized protein n=1 Tax=Lasiosphaeria hispida TaxID=260671 RepID=A0AAJ0HHZ4_9PEZI|nr:hypothetical protein B0T25DRAFT_568037 [Lasiosphaeria hispida]